MPQFPHLGDGGKSQLHVSLVFHTIVTVRLIHIKSVCAQPALGAVDEFNTPYHNLK